MRRRDRFGYPGRYPGRRTRRGWRRRDAYPVLLVGPDEPLSIVVFAAIGRWAYRHRSAFHPLVITGIVVVASAMTHRHHPQWWLPVGGVTVFVTAVLAVPHSLLRRYATGRIAAEILARLWRAWGIDRPVERAYAASVIAATGAWASVAIAIGPATKPLPAIAVVGVLVLGIPWWTHRRRRARVRIERVIQAWPDTAENMGLPDSRIVSAVVDAWGWTARVALRKGTTSGQAIDKLPAIESGLGLRPGSARALPDHTRADHFFLRVIETDPHAQPVPWPGPQTRSITNPVELGLFEDGRPVRVLILRRNVLIGGIMGAGKSGILNVILGVLTACDDAEIWGVDLKGGMELRPWTACLNRLATTPQQATTLFQDAIAELNQRAASMATQGARLWAPTNTAPAIVIVIDEYAEMPEEAQDYADSVARRGRAVAVNLIAATQRPTQQAMGGRAVRSQMDVRICLRVRERRDVDLILGQGSHSTGWHAHTLTRPGAFLISAPEHNTPERARGYLLPDEHITRHARTHAQPNTRRDPAQHTPATAPQTGREPGRDGHTPPDHHTAGLPAADGPQTPLWAALRRAGPDGAPVAELLALTGMTRPTLYRHLRAHARAGRATQTRRGRWRAIAPDSDGT